MCFQKKINIFYYFPKLQTCLKIIMVLNNKKRVQCILGVDLMCLYGVIRIKDLIKIINFMFFFVCKKRLVSIKMNE